MQLHLLTVKPHDEKGFAVNAHHFAIDGLDTLPHFLIAPHEVGKSALPINTGVMPYAPCCGTGVRFALASLDALPHFLIALHEVGKSALPINTGVMPHAPCCLRGAGDTKAQHETTRDDTDDFRNGYHGILLG